MEARVQRYERERREEERERSSRRSRGERAGRRLFFLGILLLVGSWDRASSRTSTREGRREKRKMNSEMVRAATQSMDEWFLTKATRETEFEPASDTVTARTDRKDMTFLGRYGGYDAYAGKVYAWFCEYNGLALVDECGSTGIFPLYGTLPRAVCKKWIDGAIEVAKAKGLFAAEFARGPYG